MAERMTVVVVPHDGVGDGLTVEDAMRQVLDIFDLLTSSSSDFEKQVVWRLVEATTNSPFRVTAEASPARPNINAEVIAKAQKAEFARNYASLRRGVVPSAWSTADRRRRARGLFERSRGAIAKTNIIFDPVEESIEITQADAEAVERLLDVETNLGAKTKEQIGSIEGFLLEVGTHYNKPAILVRDRKTGSDMWCIIPDEFRALVASEANFDDVWSGRRVVVHGRIIYEAPGTIGRVFATDVRRVESRSVGIEQIKDRNFTGGLSVAEYLEKLRDGNLG